MPKGAEKFIQKIAREAGEAVMKRFGKDGVHYMKSKRAWDSVTKADLLSERIIMAGIRKHYPDHGIISEESGITKGTSDYAWIIDPIDGTMYFADGIPLFAVLIALSHKKKIILGAKYLFINDTTLCHEPDLQPYLRKKIGTYKNINVYSLQ